MAPRIAPERAMSAALGHQSGTVNDGQRRGDGVHDGDLCQVGEKNADDPAQHGKHDSLTASTNQES